MGEGGGEKQRIDALHDRIEELSILLKHSRNESVVAKEEYAETSHKYFALLSELNVANRELRDLKENLEKKVRQRTELLKAANASLQEEIERHQDTLAALRESEERYRRIFENIQDIYIEVSSAGIIEEISPSVELFSDYTREQLLGKPILDYYASLKERDEFLAAIAGQGWVKDYELKFKNTNGRVLTASVNAMLLTDKTGAPVKIVASLQDITARVNAEHDLEESRQLIQEMITNAGEGIVVYDRDLNYILWNRFMENLTGLAAPQVIGRNALELFPHLRAHGIDELLRRAREGETVVSMDIPFLVEDSDRQGWVSGLYGPHRNARGEITGVIGLIRDVTERHLQKEKLEILVKERTAELAASEARYRDLFDNANDIMYVVDFKGRFIAANQAALATYEYKGEELADIALEDIADAHYLGMLKEQVRLLLRGIPRSRPYEVLTRSKAGKAIWVEVKSRSIMDGDRPVAIQGIARNITERKLAEEKIRFRERELEEKTRHLEEANAALKVFLRHREEDRRTMEARITANMQKLVIPYLNVLKESPLDKSQVHHLEILDSHLQDIVSPFLHDLTAKYPQLTMQEMKVITYIREGKSSKEIADLLNVSPRTVDGHRDHIRRKLGIDNRNINLRSFLNSLK